MEQGIEISEKILSTDVTINVFKTNLENIIC
jgi:hypothetical protein